MKTTVKLMAMATAMVALASCMDSDSVYDPNATTKQKEAQFEKQFVQQFGKIDPKNDWGFGMASSKAETRTPVTGNNISQYVASSDIPKLIKDSKPTPEEVADCFGNDTNNYHNYEVKVLGKNDLNFTDFFIQHVYAGKRTYTFENTKDNNTTTTVTEACTKMNHLKCEGEHSDSFNAASGRSENIYYQNENKTVPGDCVLMLGSKTSFTYENSFDSSVQSKYEVRLINGEYYVGFDFRTDCGCEGDDIYDDWIVKITKATLMEKEITYERRIMCEDLGTTGDFDYNDVVFDVHLENGTAYIRLVAAGGTLPLYIGDMEHEVHKLFGVSTSTMVGTGAGPDKDPVTFELSGINWYDGISVTVVNGESTYTLEAPVGGAPKKLCVKGQQKFPTERQNINEVYPEFSNYVSDASTTWYIEP